MTTPGAGFLTSFDSTTLINHTTLCGIKFAEVEYVTQSLIHVLPDGTNLAYNGTTDVTVTPSRASQVIYASTGGAAFLDSLAAKHGHYGTLVHDDQSWTAIALQPRRIGPGDLSNTAKMTIIVEFELIAEI